MPDPDPTLSSASAMGTSWRASFRQDSREKIVRQILDTLLLQVPAPGPKGVDEILPYVWKFEEKIYKKATDQDDYIRRISNKMRHLDMNSNGHPPQASSAPQTSTSSMPGKAKVHSNQNEQDQQMSLEGQLLQRQQDQAAQQRQKGKGSVALSHQVQPSVSQTSSEQAELQQWAQPFASQTVANQQAQQQHIAPPGGPGQPGQQQPQPQQQQNGLPQAQQQGATPESSTATQPDLHFADHSSTDKTAASLGSTARSSPTGAPAIVDESGIVWAKLQKLKDEHLSDMNELYGMLTTRSNQPMAAEQLQKLKHYKDVLHRMTPYLRVPKERLPKEFNTEKVDAFEKQIVNIMDTFKRKRQPSPAAGQQ